MRRLLTSNNLTQREARTFSGLEEGADILQETEVHGKYQGKA